MTELILTADVARLAGVSSETVRVWERTGRLPAQKTSRGVRLFRRDDVVRFVQERETAAHVLNPELPEEPGKERDTVFAVTR